MLLLVFFGFCLFIPGLRHVLAEGSSLWGSKDFPDHFPSTFLLPSAFFPVVQGDLLFGLFLWCGPRFCDQKDRAVVGPRVTPSPSPPLFHRVYRPFSSFCRTSGQPKPNAVADTPLRLALSPRARIFFPPPLAECCCFRLFTRLTYGFSRFMLAVPLPGLAAFFLFPFSP